MALVGGLGLAALGLPRATLDLDLLVPAEAQGRLIEFMERSGYETPHRSAGYSNHLHPDESMGRVGFVYVRGTTRDRVFSSASEIRGPDGLPSSPGLSPPDSADPKDHRPVRSRAGGRPERAVPAASRPCASGPSSRARYTNSSSSVFATAPEVGTIIFSRSRRVEISTLSSARLRLPTNTRIGKPIRSASLNLTPGRPSRSS